MAITTIFVLCSFVVGISTSVVEFAADRPFLGVSISDRAELQCCYTCEKCKNPTWVKSSKVGNKTLGPFPVDMEHENKVDGVCGILTLSSVQLEDTGMYQCMVNHTGGTAVSHGTYLQVYKPLEKTINIRESTKNKILTAEGVLLLLTVLLPSVHLIFKSKKLHQLEKKKAMKEEENIYQGLNLEDCCTTYDQIERSQAQGPYQDVCNIMEEEEEIQLEKP